MKDAIVRRRFLGVVAGACGGLGAWACSGGSSGSASSATNVDAGSDAGPSELAVPLSKVPVNGVYATAGSGCAESSGVLVGRDANGLYAYANTCTHQGGRIPPPGTGGVSRCCLHGSQFDANGDLVKGVVPGQASLPHYKLRVEGSAADAMVVVSLGVEETDRTARVPVPS